MSTHSFKLLITSLAAVAILFSSCNGTQKEAPKNEFQETAFSPCCTEPSPNTQPLTIKLAINDAYCKQTACACIHDIANREYHDLVKELKEKHNIDLQLTYFMETYNMEEKLKLKEFDGVICKPWTAFMLSHEYKIKYKRIVDVLDVFDNGLLNGVFMVKNDSPIKTLADINGKVLVTGQPDAYEKYHSPMRIMEDKNIVPSRMYQKASCLENINELLDDNADVALVSDYVLTASCAIDIANPEDFRVVAKTEDMPLTSVILDMQKISKEDALRLQNALLDLSANKTPESMMSKGFIKPINWTPVIFEPSVE